jgi:hypothetical protein
VRSRSSSCGSRVKSGLFITSILLFTVHTEVASGGCDTLTHLCKLARLDRVHEHLNQPVARGTFIYSIKLISVNLRSFSECINPAKFQNKILSKFRIRKLSEVIVGASIFYPYFLASLMTRLALSRYPSAGLKSPTQAIYARLRSPNYTN